jgi:hypothetical protein
MKLKIGLGLAVLAISFAAMAQGPSLAGEYVCPNKNVTVTQQGDVYTINSAALKDLPFDKAFSTLTCSSAARSLDFEGKSIPLYSYCNQVTVGHMFQYSENGQAMHAGVSLTKLGDGIIFAFSLILLKDSKQVDTSEGDSFYCHLK